MKNMLHHVALCVTDYDWHVNFFETVFDMHSYREIGLPPNRKIWFKEGIQLDELPDSHEDAMKSMFPPHLGFQTDNLEAILEKAFEFGCRPYGEKHHWFITPNGLKVEIKENPPVILDIL